MLYKLTQYYKKPSNVHITTTIMGSYDILESYLEPCQPTTYWFITILNFGYLYNSNRELLDHYDKVPGTNTYKSHTLFAGSELILTDDNKFQKITYGSGLPVIDYSTGSVEVRNEKLMYNWPIPKNECHKCLMMTPPGPYSDHRYQKMITKSGEVRGVVLKGHAKDFKNLLPNF